MFNQKIIFNIPGCDAHIGSGVKSKKFLCNNHFHNELEFLYMKKGCIRFFIGDETADVKEGDVFFVNSKNPMENITIKQIQDIYSGEITKWDELNVNGFGDIRAFQRDEGSGSQTALVKLMGDKPLMKPIEENVIGGMGGIISKTADYKNYKNAIGYSFRYYSREMVNNNQIKLLNIEGIAPTIENIENGTYPVASEFFAVTRIDADENTKKLLDWVVSEQGQELVEKTGYTPVK